MYMRTYDLYYLLGAEAVALTVALTEALTLTLTLTVAQIYVYNLILYYLLRVEVHVS
jgi:hypothetical protein